MARRLPKLPAEVFSLLAPIPVVDQAGEEESEDWGGTQFGPRVIGVHSDASPLTRWQTLGHEMGHIILWDGGAHQQLTKKQREAVCDALGTYIAAAVQAGYMKITVPKTSVKGS